MRPQSWGVLAHLETVSPQTFGDLYGALSYTETSIEKSLEELLDAGLIVSDPHLALEDPEYSIDLSGIEALKKRRQKQDRKEAAQIARAERYKDEAQF